MNIKVGDVLKLYNFFSLLNCPVLILNFFHAVSFSWMLFSLIKHYLDTDTALKASQFVYYCTICFTTVLCVLLLLYLMVLKTFFPRLWGTGISDAIFFVLNFVLKHNYLVLKMESLFPC